MKTGFIFLIVGCLLLTASFFKKPVRIDAATIDLYIFDTYYVMTFWALAVFVILILASLFAFGGVLGTRFHNKPFFVAGHDHI